MKLDVNRLGFLIGVCFLVIQVQYGRFGSAQKVTKPFKPKPTKPTKPPKTPKPEIMQCGAKTDLVFLLDSSTSVGTSGFKNVLEFIVGMLRHADVATGNVRVGLMTYQSRPDIHFHLNNKHRTIAALEKAIKAVPYTPGSTNAALALKMMRESMFTPPSGDRPLAPNVAMLITDGVSNLDADRTIPEAVASHQKGIHIFVVGIGLTDTVELEQMASPPGRENLFPVKSFDELTKAQIRTKTFKAMCDMIVLNGRATNRPATTPTPAPSKEKCPKLADIAFLVDSSSSLTDLDYQQAKLFITDLIFELPVDGGTKARVSVTSYASSPRTVFHLNQYRTLEDIAHQVAVMTHQRGSRNLVEGVRALQREVFTAGRGDRPAALNVVVIVTRSRLDENTRTVAQALGQLEDTHVIFVGVGNDEGNLRDLVTPSSKLFMASSFEETTTLKNQILAQICEVCDSYTPDLRSTTLTITIRPTTQRITPTTQRITPAPQRTTPTTRRTITTGIVPTTTTGPRTTTPKYNCRVSGDLVWLLDSSGSVGQHNFHQTLDFIANLTSHLDIDENMYRVSLVTFSDSDHTVFDLTNRSREEVLGRIESTRYLYGSTNIYSALRRARTQILANRTGRGNRPDIPDLCILITDGQSNVYPERTVPEARLLKRQGVALAGIGIKLANNRELEEMVSEPKSKFAMVLDDFDDLGSLQPGLVQLLCHSTDQCRKNPCKNGGRCSSVFDEYFCRCLMGFTGRDCQKSCQTKSDVVFVLDSSGSVGEVNFQQMKDFLKRFLDEVDVESCSFRIGVLKFGSSAFVQFHLNSYSTTEDLTAAIDNIRYSHGFTYTADAVRVARESMFQRARGDRPDARNVLVFLTEGQANVLPRQTLDEVRKARNAGIHLVPIGIGSNNREEMKAMATHERGIFFVDRFSQLENITSTLADYILEDVDQCQPNPCQNGGVCEDRIHDFVCKCTPGFSGKACARKCSSQSDIAFLVDTTSYMGPQNFAKVKDFVKNLVDRLALWNGESRVGLVTFSGVPTIRRYLNEPATKDDILGAIHALQYDGGYPSTSEALDLLSYKLFTGPNGDRPQAHNYAVLITAGQLYSEFELPRNQQPRHAGIHVFGIGIGLQEGDKRRMNEIVSDPNASAFTADDPERLNDVAEKIANVICEDPDLCSSLPCQNGGTCTDAVNSFSCMCIAGYAGTECEKECPSKADVVFLVDSSGSIGQRNFARSQDFLSKLAGELNIGAGYTRVSMITFSSKAKIAFYLDSHRSLESVQRAIHGAQFVYGDANIADAFRLARESIFTIRHGDRPEVRNIIVLLTDGVGNVTPTRTIPEAEKCREAGIHVVSVGIGMENTADLEEFVSEPKNDNVLRASDFNSLNTVLAKVYEVVCDDGDSCDSNHCQNNGTCVDGIRTFKCLCTDGYSGKNCEKGYHNPIDLAFVIDSSVSVGRRNFNKVLDFIASFVRSLPIDSRTARIAIVTYSNGATVRFYLSTYVRRSDILRRIENLEYDRGGTTNTAEALRVIREDVFNIYRGDRPTAANIAVLITDGVSNVKSHETLPEAVKVHEDGIQVYAIGVGMNSTKEVEGMASRADTFFRLRSYDELEGVGDSLLDKFMELKPVAKATPKPTLRPTIPPTVPRATKVAASTTVPRPTTVRSTARPTTKAAVTRPPTTPTTTKPRLGPGEACQKRLDLVFAFDTSGGLPRPQFTNTLNFAKRFVGQLNVGARETRVGAIGFSNNIRTAFHLDQASTLDDVRARLGKVPYRTGPRNLKQGMAAIRDTMFLDQNGNRGDIPNVAIIITDGFYGEERTTFEEEGASVAERGIQLFQIVWQQKGKDPIQSGERLFAVNSLDTLMAIVDDVKQAVCDVGSA